MIDQFTRWVKKAFGENSHIIVSVLVLTLIGVLMKPYIDQGKLTPKALKVKPKEECTPQEAQLILSDSVILEQMDLFPIDLKTMRYISSDLTTEYHTKQKMFGVKRERIVGANQVYLMLYEPVSDLKHNKDEYNRYLEGNEVITKVKDVDNSLQ